ncbi:MAG TPA: amidohydrolase family protein [Candidatus Eisenbacteria bacterium]|nr:amidohydrolase family protein [Candidatus Eisenbacteria bacterium]
MHKNTVLWHFVLLTASTGLLAQQYDVLIRNGRVVDGSGNPWTYADVGLMGDRVAFVGRAASGVTAKRTIDATGLVVAPGFIDMLGQSEFNLLVDKQAVSKLTQGVTTEITGEGESIAPTNDALNAEHADVLQHYRVTADWRSLEEYSQRLTKQGSGINLGTYIGAAQVRRLVIGTADRTPTAAELKDMEIAVDDAMSDGAMGVSSALIYAPGSYAKTDELIALAKVAAAKGGVYASHIRNEGDSEANALNEAFRIGRDANIPVQIFHLKVSGQQNWGKMPQVINAIEQARASGIDVTANQYPYTASATSLGAIIPPEYHEGGTDAYVARLKDPATRAQIRKELEEPNGSFENMWRGTGGPNGVMVVSVLNPEFRKFEGKTVAQIAQMENTDPLDAALDLIVADRDNVGAVYFSMSEDDVKLAMRQPWVSVGTDYGEVSPTGPLGESKSHPRAYGSFARILGKYVREEHVLRLEDAIRKFTSLPAQQVKLENRGLLRPGYFADITIFNPETVKDVATFEDPNRTSVGFEYVFVNGVLALAHDKVTGQLGGRPLRGPGYMMRDYVPEGLPPRGKVQGAVTDEGGYPVPRTTLTLSDRQGKTVATTGTKIDGRYELVLEQPCQGCSLKAERRGFVTQERGGIRYNGSNSLWFSFAMKRSD